MKHYMTKTSTNNWYVLTGSPCSGKTTVLRCLQKMGFRVEYEIARTYIDEEIKKGKTLSDIRRDEVIFQMEVLKRKVACEKLLPKNELIFFERGIPDSLAYLMLCKSDINEDTKKIIQQSDYKKIFLLEMLPYQKDYARTEDGKTAKQIERLLEQSYRDFGFDVIKVPVDSVEHRIQYIKQAM